MIVGPSCSYTVTDNNGKTRRVSRAEYEQLRTEDAHARERYRGDVEVKPVYPP